MRVALDDLNARGYRSVKEWRVSVGIPLAVSTHSQFRARLGLP